MGKRIRSVTREPAGGITLELAGVLDGAAAAEICHQVETLGARECRLDFSGVKGIELFGASILSRGLKRLKERGVRCQVGHVPKRVAGRSSSLGVLELLI